MEINYLLSYVAIDAKYEKCYHFGACIDTFSDAEPNDLLRNVALEETQTHLQQNKGLQCPVVYFIGELAGPERIVQVPTQYNLMMICFDKDDSDTIRLYNYTFRHEVPTSEDIREAEKSYAERNPEFKTVICVAFNRLYAQE